MGYAEFVDIASQLKDLASLFLLVASLSLGSCLPFDV